MCNQNNVYTQTHILLNAEFINYVVEAYLYNPKKLADLILSLHIVWSKFIGKNSEVSITSRIRHQMSLKGSNIIG